MVSPQRKVDLYLCEFGCGFCGSYGTVASHEASCAKGLAALERGLGALGDGDGRGGRRDRSRSRSPRGVHAAHVQVGDDVVIFHSADPGRGSWPGGPGNPYRRRYDAMVRTYAFREDELPPDGTRGRVEQVYDEWGQRGVVVRVRDQGGKCYYVGMDGVARARTFDADMGRLQELEERAEAEGLALGSAERRQLLAEAHMIRTRYELEPLLYRAFHAERQKFNLLQGLEETARQGKEYMNAATFWQEQRESAERMCETLGELSKNAMERGERDGAAETFKEAVGVLNDVLARGEGLVAAYRQASGHTLASSDGSSTRSDEEEHALSDDDGLSDTAPDAYPVPDTVWSPTDALLGSSQDFPRV